MVAVRRELIGRRGAGQMGVRHEPVGRQRLDRPVDGAELQVRQGVLRRLEQPLHRGVPEAVERGQDHQPLTGGPEAVAAQQLDVLVGPSVAVSPAARRSPPADLPVLGSPFCPPVRVAVVRHPRGRPRRGDRRVADEEPDVLGERGREPLQLRSLIRTPRRCSTPSTSRRSAPRRSTSVAVAFRISNELDPAVGEAHGPQARRRRGGARRSSSPRRPPG